MVSGWEVRIEGDFVAHPDCQHEDFDRHSLTVDPPIAEVVCRVCGRRLWRRTERVKDQWPEDSTNG